MERTLQVFVVADGVPRPDGEHAVTADSLDAMAAAARLLLTSLGHRVRCVSFTPTGLLAYTEKAS